MTRVLLVNSHGADRTFGGAERYVRDLATGLQARGHEVALLSGFPVRDESATVTRALHRSDWRDDRLRRYRNHAGDWVAGAWRQFEDVLLEDPPDLVHTSNLPGIGTGLWERARRLGIPVVHTLHDYHLLCPRTSLTRRDGTPCRPSPLLCGLRARRLARWGPGVRVAIGVSAHVLARHEGFFPPSTSRRVIRPPLAPIEGANSQQPAALATLGYLGALTRSKGVELLLEAAPALARQRVALRIAGDGPLRRAVQAAPDVTYVGRVQGAGIAEFLMSCDAGVVPSLWEEPGLTFVVYEWLAAGRPVVATQRGGLAEAALLGGVVTFDGTSDRLTGTVGRLTEQTVWQQVVAGVPLVEDDRDVERWISEHEAAYSLSLQPGLSPAAL